MREPVTNDVAFEWWRAAVEHYPQFVPNWPQPGFYKCRLAKAGVYVPARIWLEQETDASGELIDEVRVRCEVNGRAADPDDVWPYLAKHPISAREFRYLTARNAWAGFFAPDDPAARPYEPVDPLKTPILF